MLTRRARLLPLLALLGGCYADSSEPCVDGLEHGASYRITLGERLPSVPLHTGAVSCGAIKDFDGLVTGSTLDVVLPKGEWSGNQYCQVPLADLKTDLGLMLTPLGHYGLSANGGQPDEEMFVVNERGSSGDCPLQWSIDAVSKNGVAAFPAGAAGQDLYVVRSVNWAVVPGCPPPNPDSIAACFDAWKISLEAVTP
jgi:hypothetical protein